MHTKWVFCAVSIDLRGRRWSLVLLFLVLLCATSSAQYVSKVWVADQNDGTYKNPIIYADYSDPDVCAVGDDFYMTASSFGCAPGLPVLHSKDLVNWENMCKRMEEGVPQDTIGGMHHYHAYTYGILTGRLAELIDGRPFQQLLKEEILNPLQLEHLFFGIDREQYENNVAFLDGSIAAPDDGRLKYNNFFVLNFTDSYDIIGQKTNRNSQNPAITGAQT